MAVMTYVYFLIFCSNFQINSADSSLKVGQDEKFLSTVSGSISFLVKWLERFNDAHIGNSSIGRFIHYEDLKPEFGVGTNRGKSGKT